ncbi:MULTISPECIES: hypothetical protein [Kaistia]|uniref:Uncharacterized protein n=1 Tax=Kaistia defluvii TaxID=410841 RepID=A0ABV2R0Q5_9HYPH
MTTTLLMSELIICEVLTALEQHEPVDLRASARRCKERLPAHHETEAELCERLERLAMEYGAAIVIEG